MLGADSSATRRRRIIGPALIVLVGVALAIWASQRTTQQARDIHALVVGWCAAAARGEEPTVPAETDFMSEQVAEAIALACRAVDPSLAALEVVVTPGDTANLHPAIMHTALIRIGGTDKLELGFVVRGERYLVVGVQRSRNGDAPPSRP